MKGLDKLVSEIRRTNSLDWREFNFFKAGVGLSRNDQLSIQVCLDYEFAREWRLMVEVLANCSEKQRQDVLSMPETRRYAAIPCDSDLPLENTPDAPLVPTACIEASWFPEPWLSGPAKERENIVKKLAEFYDRVSWLCNAPSRYAVQPLSVFDFPMDEAGFRQSVPKLSEAKRRAEKRLRYWGYI